MTDDEPTRPEETPPGPQPDQALPSDDDNEDETEQGSDSGPGVTEESADSFPASDPPSW